MKSDNDTSSAKAQMTETEFLAGQARRAREAIGPALSSAIGNTARGADPRMWAKSFPKSSVAAALLAGFTAAVVAVPSREEQALRRLINLQRLATGAPKEPDPQNATGQQSATAQNSATQDHATKPSLMWVILKEIFNVAKPMLLSIATGYMAKSHAPEEPQNIPPSSSAASAPASSASGRGLG